MATITKYATTLESMRDTRFQTNEWMNLENGVGNTNVATSSTYSKNFVPQQLYAHDFGIELPEQHIIESIKFEIKIRGSVQDTKVPTAYYELLSINKHTDTDYGNAVYSDQPDTNISNAFNIITYEMDKSKIQEFRATRDKIENDRFGVVLKFEESGETGAVSIEWIRAVINYSEPQFISEIRGHLTPNSYEAQYLYYYKTGDFFSVLFYVHNPITYKSQPKTVQLDLPVGLRIEYYEESIGASFDPNTRKLTLDWSKIGSPYVKIHFRATTVGLKKLSIIGDGNIGSTTQYLYIRKGVIEQDDEIVIISSTDVRRCDYSDFFIGVKAFSRDGQAGYEFNLRSDISDQNENTFVSFELDEALTSPNVSIEYQTKSYVLFNVPPSEEVEIYFTVRFLPDFDGAKTFRVTPEDTGYIYDYEYDCLEAYRYVIDVRYENNKDIVFTNARLVSKVDTGAYVYPMGVSEYDNPLVMEKPTLKLTKYEDIDYIGCVALEQTHYDPKSTFKDTLLNTSSKNKTYMGKKGVIDETITLNVRLHPYDVTTIQGLISMDKPVPINTNHLAFEGDSLNHRGWAELYGIVSKKTNPHWYDCDLSVKYITHNLNTRFNINKGSRVSEYFLPELMTDVCIYGQDLTENFYIETNGGYTYSKDIEDYHMRNMLALPNLRRFKIKSNDSLSLKSQINLNWYSTRNSENKDNEMARIVRIVDEVSGNAVFEYEWYDIDWSRTYEFTSRVIARVLYKGAYKTILNRNLVLNTDAEYDSDEFGDIDVYGSELILKIVADKISIQDCGNSGKELFIENIDLEGGHYYLEVEFINQNTDGDAPDIMNWMDIAIKELDFSSKYSEYYGNLLISPFPVPKKEIVFTRDSEEGTIFYLNDDGTECSYIVNPYFQYHCGVDLQTKDKISIFNLDNNYRTFYITNGLVKVGIDRYSGRMAIAKYDKYSKTYITTSMLQFIKYEDININNYTDDKIEIQVSDTTLTMWRGHPYIALEHPTEDILLLQKFTKVYGNGVGNISSDIPQYWSLVDSTNLLSECIASDRKIKEDCFTATEEEVEDPSTLVDISIIENGGLARSSFIVADCPYEWDGMKFIIDGEILDGTPPESGDIEPFTHKIYYHFDEVGIHTAKAVYWKGAEYYLSNDLEFEIVDNAYRITPTFPSTMINMEYDFTCLLTFAGEPVEGETVTFYVNGLSYSKITDENGVATLNNHLMPKDEPYVMSIRYSEGGEILAMSDTEFVISKGYVKTDMYSSDYIHDHSKPKGTVTKGGYVIVQLTNTLDPNDGQVTIDETYIADKQVVLSINGRDYIRMTDNEGKAKLNINLFQGAYDLKVSFAGDYYYMGTIKNYELRVIE